LMAAVWHPLGLAAAPGTAAAVQGACRMAPPAASVLMLGTACILPGILKLIVENSLGLSRES